MRRRLYALGMIAACCGLCLVTMGSAASKGADVKTLARAIDAEYHLHGERMHMMWAVSLVARVSTGGGVHGMQLVTYEEVPATVDRGKLMELVRRNVDDEWSLMVRENSAAKDGEGEMAWTQPHGKGVRMLVVSFDGSELDLVQMELDPDALARWKREHGDS